MTLASNQFSLRLLGSKNWQLVMRAGYIGMFFILLHVFLLKSLGWLIWFRNGMQEPLALSLLMAFFALVVIIFRLALWLSLKRRRKNAR